MLNKVLYTRRNKLTRENYLSLLKPKTHHLIERDGGSANIGTTTPECISVSDGSQQGAQIKPTDYTDHKNVTIYEQDAVDMAIKRRMSVLDSSGSDHEYNFNWFDILIAIGSIVIFFVDIATDIKLAVEYFHEQKWFYGVVTTILIVVPSIVTCSLGLHWYILDYKAVKEDKLEEKNKTNKSKESFETETSNGSEILVKYIAVTPVAWFCRFFFTILQCGPVVRYVWYCSYILFMNHYFAH